jgi:hypothetical protein
MWNGHKLVRNRGEGNRGGVMSTRASITRAWGEGDDRNHMKGIIVVSLIVPPLFR